MNKGILGNSETRENFEYRRKLSTFACRRRNEKVGIKYQNSKARRGEDDEYSVGASLLPPEVGVRTGRQDRATGRRGGSPWVGSRETGRGSEARGRKVREPPDTTVKSESSASGSHGTGSGTRARAGGGAEGRLSSPGEHEGGIRGRSEGRSRLPQQPAAPTRPRRPGPSP